MTLMVGDFGLEAICKGYSLVIIDRTGFEAPYTPWNSERFAKFFEALKRFPNCSLPKVVIDEVRKEERNSGLFTDLCELLDLRATRSIDKKRQKALRYRCHELARARNMKLYNATAAFYALAHPREAAQHDHLVRAAYLTAEPHHATLFLTLREEFQIPKDRADVYQFKKDTYELVTQPVTTQTPA